MAEWKDGINPSESSQNGKDIKELKDLLAALAKQSLNLNNNQKEIFEKFAKKDSEYIDKLIKGIEKQETNWNKLFKEFNEDQRKHMNVMQESVDVAHRRLTISENLLDSYAKHEDNLLKFIQHSQRRDYIRGAERIGNSQAKDRQELQDRNFGESFKDILAETSPLFKLFSGRNTDLPGSHKQRMIEQQKSMGQAYDQKYADYQKDQFGRAMGVNTHQGHVDTARSANIDYWRTAEGFAAQNAKDKAYKDKYGVEPEFNNQSVSKDNHQSTGSMAMWDEEFKRYDSFQDINLSSKGKPHDLEKNNDTPQHSPSWGENRNKLSLLGKDDQEAKNSVEGGKLANITFNAGDVSKMQKRDIVGPQMITEEIRHLAETLTAAGGKEGKTNNNNAVKMGNMAETPLGKIIKALGSGLSNPYVLGAILGIAAGTIVISAISDFMNEGDIKNAKTVEEANAATAAATTQGSAAAAAGIPTIKEYSPAVATRNAESAVNINKASLELGDELFKENSTYVKDRMGIISVIGKDGKSSKLFNVNAIPKSTALKWAQYYSKKHPEENLKFPAGSEESAAPFIYQKFLQAKYNPIVFDKGGIVPGNIGSAVSATVHAGETIIPSHKPQVRENLDKLINGPISDSSEEVKKLLILINETNKLLLEEMKKNTLITDKKELKVPENAIKMPPPSANRQFAVVNQ